MTLRPTLVLLVVATMRAQQVVAPTNEPVGPVRGEDINGYNVVNSFETGYRFALVGGNEGKYRSDIDYGNGIRLLGSKMLFGNVDQETGTPEEGRDLAVFPLAIPAIAGPGAIMAVILLTDNDVYSIAQQAMTAAVLLVVLALNYLLLLASDGVLRVIGRQGAAILVRVMGIILAALSVELVLKALSIGSWATSKH